MDQGDQETTASRAALRHRAPVMSAPAPHETHAPGAVPAPRRRRRGQRLWLDLTALAVIGVLVVAALTAGGVALYRHLYSPTAFVASYLELLAEGRAVDALGVAGVALDSAAMEREDLPAEASEALLRGSALSSLTDIKPVSETQRGDVTEVTFAFRAGGFEGTTTFRVEPNGWIGVAPTWRFAQSPLAVVDLTVAGAMRFAVNDFPLDIRQVALEGAAAAAGEKAPMLVLSPGLYTVSVSTPISTAEDVNILADKPLADIPVRVQATPTEKFIETVQEEVDGFLDACTTQEVLQPTGCPFGFFVADRIASLPQWSIVDYPKVKIVPDGSVWSMPTAIGVARVEVEVRSLYDGSLSTVIEDVPFEISAGIDVLPDDTVSIHVNANEAGEE